MRNAFSLATGVIATCLYLSIVGVLADAPAANALPHRVLFWASQNRATLLASAPVWTLSVAFLFAFYLSVGADLVDRCSTRTERTLVHLGVVGGFLTFIISLIGFLFLTALAWLAPAVSPDIAVTLNVLSLLAINLSGIPTALTLLPWTWVMHRNKLASELVVFLGIVVSALHLVSAWAFQTHGLMSPSGIGVYLGPPLFYVWVVAVGWLRLRKA